MVGGRRGVKNGPAGGGFGFFLQGGGAVLAPGGGKGTVKLQKRVLKMCKFAFLRHIFYDFYLQYGENFLVTMPTYDLLPD